MIKEMINKYITFIKYIGSAGISYVIDMLVFIICSYLFREIKVVSYILISTVVARVISSLINFILNKNKVFSNSNLDNKTTDLLINYYLLVIIQMFMSAILVEIVYKLIGINLIIVKFLIDCCIFVANYFIQKKFIFNNKILKFNEAIKKIIVFIKENKLISVILIVSLILHGIALKRLGINYSLNSDDASYIISGINFKNNLTIIMHDGISAQIMPGMTYMIALMAYLFGEGKLLMLALKILWAIMGTLSILGVYRITRIFSNKLFSSIAAVMLLAVDFIWMDNLILTETPFMFGFIYLIYATIKIAKTKENKYFYQIIFFFLFCVLLKANIAVYPLFLILYLLLNRYDYKLMIKQLVIAGGIMLLFFVPWIIRNYIVFDKFIPLTYGTGNPKLLGTYQGVGFPEDNQEEYDKYINKHASDEMKSYLDGTAKEKLYKRRYYALEKDGLIAEYRIKQWWKNDRKSMLKSYLYYKPRTIMINSFYWDSIWNITKDMVVKFRKIEIIISSVATMIILFNRKYIRELIFLGANYLTQVLVYSMTFAFDRYGQTLIFIRFIIIGIALQIMWDYIKKVKSKIDLKSKRI